jgi:hypothetical protein
VREFSVSDFEDPLRGRISIGRGSRVRADYAPRSLTVQRK